jgi:hypothetical protein
MAVSVCGGSTTGGIGFEGFVGMASGEYGKIRGHMKKRTGKPKQDPQSFERKVAELKAELEKLPADRQEQLKREFETETAQAGA